MTTLLLAALVAAGLQAQTIPPAAAQADYDLLIRSLQEAHGGLERFATRAELARRWETHRARIDRPLSALQLGDILTLAVNELRDGHARLEYDSASARALANARLLPLRVQMEDGRLVVLFNDTPHDSAIHPGMELLSINGRPTRDIIRTLLPRIPGDGFIETRKRFLLGRLLGPLYWWHIEQADTFDVTARSATGRTVAARLPGVLERDRRSTMNPVNALMTENSARLRGPAGNVALQFMGGIAVLRVRAFGGDNFPALLDSAFRTVRDSSTRGLVLDLRGNGGGVDQYGAKLMSYFLAAPFRYFDHIRLTTIAPSFATWLPRTFESTRAGTVPDSTGGFRVTPALHDGVGEQQPTQPGFTGRLVVLIDGGTFSTAADVAAQLNDKTDAVFLGEETGGGYQGNTSGLNALIVLPNSGHRLRIMMYDYWNAVRPPAMPGRGTLPDHVIIARVNDILQGRDAALEHALQLAR